MQTTLKVYDYMCVYNPHRYGFNTFSMQTALKVYTCMCGYYSHKYAVNTFSMQIVLKVYECMCGHTLVICTIAEGCRIARATTQDDCCRVCGNAIEAFSIACLAGSDMAPWPHCGSYGANRAIPTSRLCSDSESRLCGGSYNMPLWRFRQVVAVIAKVVAVIAKVVAMIAKVVAMDATNPCDGR